ncbi:unnamed protein product [Penicillium salamii]|uniref:Uncharacterized protein n=1 Tax=Penicillium salamii TaxID=1612424 RepID=A0A9W4NQX2_9EURO|nr:unnamed protein product [Penicillium salamii]CAG8335672.1 unnamed protein product [Penicillium salamii]CAG8339099.1 unnamed protein product [Penicillium salamii]CAG8387766.1 unnamed protein product [Penicillium salamii]CAG8395544.1 unnamed protein product [Penicillium salamii]
MTEFRMPLHQGPPARKPLGGPQHGYGYQHYDAPRGQLAPHLASPQTTHSRTRTTSSSVFPSQASQQYYGAPPPPPIPQTMPLPHHPSSRRMSSTTTSTSSTGNHPMAQAGHGVSDIRRTASSRSANSQLGYVALMRRQKATVWCDRSQPEDARMREQAMRAKKRAYLEVHGSGARAGTLNSGKIRHGPKGAAEFSPSNLVGAKVPVRLSANEVGDGDDDAISTDGGAVHRRTGSGRSSLGSAHRYPSGYNRPQGTMGSNSTPPNEKTDLPEVSENTTAEIQEEEKSRLSSLIKDDAATTHSSEQEQEDAVGDMQAPSAATAAAEKAKKAADLRRRGSVDERTTSMTNVRLFVANPDSDSD